MKFVSERLGPSSPAFTMTVYQHRLPRMQADAAAMFSNVVFRVATPRAQSLPQNRMMCSFAALL